MVGLLSVFGFQIIPKIKRLTELFFQKSAKNPHTDNRDIKLRSKSTKQFKQENAVVFIASPCSASNTALRVLSDTLDLPIVRAKVESGFGHNIIDPSYANIDYTHILYQHCFPTKRNIKIISKVSVNPCLISYRNIYDWVVSMSEYFIRVGRCPTGVSFDKSLVSKTNFKEVSDYVIHFELSWYIRLLNGWLHASNQNKKLKLFPIHFSRIVNGSGLKEFVSLLPKDLSNFKKEIESIPKVNFNKGKSGRGVNKLSESQIALINKKMNRIPISHKKKLPGLME